MVKRLLVAYDFADDSELALKYGLSVAQQHQAELLLLHVLRSGTVNEPEVAGIPWVKTLLIVKLRACALEDHSRSCLSATWKPVCQALPCGLLRKFLRNFVQKMNLKRQQPLLAEGRATAHRLPF